MYSVNLLAAFCSVSPGMNLLSPYDTLLIVSVFAIIFVDDGMLSLNDATEVSPRLLPDLLDDAEKSAESWV
jgi:hypothetical protein